MDVEHVSVSVCRGLFVIALRELGSPVLLPRRRLEMTLFPEDWVQDQYCNINITTVKMRIGCSLAVPLGVSYSYIYLGTGTNYLALPVYHSVRTCRVRDYIYLVNGGGSGVEEGWRLRIWGVDLRMCGYLDSGDWRPISTTAELCTSYALHFFPLSRVGIVLWLSRGVSLCSHAQTQ